MIHFCRVFFFLVLAVYSISTDAQEQTPPATTGQKTPVTQMGNTGNFDVTLKEAKIVDNIMTVVLIYENTSSARIKLAYPLGDVYFIDNTEKKKYHALKDEKGAWLAAPACGDLLSLPTNCEKSGVELEPKGKQVVWFKFPAPTGANINFIVPDAIPFDNIAVTK